MLNIQPLTIRSLSHSSSSLKCAEGKAYNEKIQFVQTIIYNCDIIGTSTIEFLRKRKQHWHAREQIGLGATLIDLMCIEKSEEDKAEEQHFVEAIVNKRRAIMDKVTFLEKAIKIPDLEQFMWTQTKQNYDKHVEQMEN